MTEILQAARRRCVSVGNLEALVDGLELRYVRASDREFIRRVYPTLREADWHTPAIVPNTIELRSERDRSSLSANATSNVSGVQVDWWVKAEIEESHLVYEVHARPQQSLLFNRLGMCILFPPELLVGAHYEAEAPDGTRSVGVFSEAITPQQIAGDTIFPLFPAFTRLGVRTSSTTLELRFEGDLLEMEDQRNWSDSSFKAYCTPLALPRPRQANPDKPVIQRVVISVQHQAANSRRARKADDTISIDLAGAANTLMPVLGATLKDGEPSPAEMAAIKELGLEHLRVEIASADRAEDVLRRARALVKGTATALAPVLFLPSSEDEVGAYAQALVQSDAPIARIFVFPSDGSCDAGDLSMLLRRMLNGSHRDVPIIGGTDGWFVELNRNRPNSDLMDGLTWAVTPQVHATDTLSLFENLDAQGDQVRTARLLARGRQITVGPITLAPRPRGSGDHVPLPDPRHGSNCEAAWVVGSLRALSEAGTTSLTYFETGGSESLLDAAGKPTPAARVLRLANSLAGAPVWRTRSTKPLLAQALAISRNREIATLIVANFSDSPRRLRVGPMTWASAHLEILTNDQSESGSAPQAQEHDVTKDGWVEVNLDAYGVTAATPATRPTG